jgi:hypothetical protein
LIIFLLITVGMLCLGIYSWTNGNFQRLTTASDNTKSVEIYNSSIGIKNEI